MKTYLVELSDGTKAVWCGEGMQEEAEEQICLAAGWMRLEVEKITWLPPQELRVIS